MPANHKLHLENTKTPWLERFGLFYLYRFSTKNNNSNAFNKTDDELYTKVRRITARALLLTCLISLLAVWPAVWVDVYFSEASFWVHYGWLAGVTLLAIVIELYVLFWIALKSVHKVSLLVNMQSVEKDFLKDGAFSIKNILARTALELPDPELKILGINPFKRISKKNLLVLSLLYKAKIFLTNFLLKYALIFFIGKTVFGISILYEALLVECFWNCLVIIKVIREARLRLFGFALANKIADDVLHDDLINQVSPLAKEGAMRAIGNAVVLTQNYHPNMVILILRFQELLDLSADNRYDDWNLFVQTLEQVSFKERNFLLDLFTVAVCFDGKISRLETNNLRMAYKADYDLYYPRLNNLVADLKNGRLHSALALCKIDFKVG